MSRYSSKLSLISAARIAAFNARSEPATVERESLEFLTLSVASVMRPIDFPLFDGLHSLPIFVTPLDRTNPVPNLDVGQPLSVAEKLLCARTDRGLERSIKNARDLACGWSSKRCRNIRGATCWDRRFFREVAWDLETARL